MSAHFEVGKKVICIQNHSQRIVKTGEIFELQGIKKRNCIHETVMLNVGIVSNAPRGADVLVGCSKCNIRSISDGMWWICASLFAPYDDSLSDITCEELLEEMEVFANSPLYLL